MTVRPVWQEPAPVSVPADLAEWADHPLVAQLLARRGIRTVSQARAFMDPAFYRPAPPEALPGLEAASARVIRSIETGEKICVWGDFDVDGQTATALLVEALRDFGADVFHHIPVRKTESHGMSVAKVGEMIDRGAALILTCDTGSGEHESIRYANERGVDVVVTDHHKLSETLPPAAAFVNPQLLQDGHPLKTLPGVGVVYKLVEFLAGYFGKPDLAARGLDLAALGIVADVAEQVGDTRWLLQRGIGALRETRRTGLQELFKLAEIEAAVIDTETIGFAIGPRLNAIGRLGDANPIVEFLTTEDVTQAKVLAGLLEGLNEERRLITDQIYASALALIEAAPELAAGPVLVLARKNWEPGVIGIVAARLVERFGIPAVMISIDPGGFGRGSARSVDGIDITAAIAGQSDLLESFGGHTMAGGLSISADRIDEFRLRLNNAIRTLAPIRPFTDSLSIDGYLTLSEIDITLISDLDRLSPFGPGNPRPLLATRDVELRSAGRIGRGRDHLRLVVADRDEAVQEVVWWNPGDAEPPKNRFDLAYTLGLNTFKGQRQVQVVWRAARERVSGSAGAQTAGRLKITDLRRSPDPAGELARLRARGGLVVWGGEADEPETDAGERPTLAVWTIPSGSGELAGLIERCDPGEIVLFGNPPPDVDPEAFLRRLTGLLRQVVRAHDGRISIERLVSGVRQPRTVVDAGLDYLVARDIFRVVNRGGQLQVEAGPGETKGAAEAAWRRIQRAMGESAAFRRFYLSADPDQLLGDADSEKK